MVPISVRSGWQPKASLFEGAPDVLGAASRGGRAVSCGLAKLFDQLDRIAATADAQAGHIFAVFTN